VRQGVVVVPEPVVSVGGAELLPELEGCVPCGISTIV
jgi:hypothetical protein